MLEQAGQEPKGKLIILVGQILLAWEAQEGSVTLCSGLNGNLLTSECTDKFQACDSLSILSLKIYHRTQVSHSIGDRIALEL